VVYAADAMPSTDPGELVDAALAARSGGSLAASWARPRLTIVVADSDQPARPQLVRRTQCWVLERPRAPGRRRRAGHRHRLKQRWNAALVTSWATGWRRSSERW
jgi:hypothetical protein